MSYEWHHHHLLCIFFPWWAHVPPAGRTEQTRTFTESDIPYDCMHCGDFSTGFADVTEGWRNMHGERVTRLWIKGVSQPEDESRVTPTATRKNNTHTPDLIDDNKVLTVSLMEHPIRLIDSESEGSEMRLAQRRG